ncbi:MAG: phosphate-starvation-inducible PsiE family protein [Candidatus Gracilibacteria bacterium]|nr:phosphate-starvation-inducible PsiE family protein [Candidatus Gracilibacteria bacterium]
MFKIKNAKLDKLINSLDNSFDYIFIMLSITTVVFTFVLLFNFFIEIYHDGFNISLLFEIGLTALISVKFYKVIKDYIGDHKIELSNLAEIGIVAILSELIFKLEKISTEDVLIRILLLVILIVFYYLEKYIKVGK